MGLGLLSFVILVAIVLHSKLCDATPVVTLTPETTIFKPGDKLKLNCSVNELVDLSSVSFYQNNTQTIWINNVASCSFFNIIPNDKSNYSIICDPSNKTFTMIKYGLNVSDNQAVWFCRMVSKSGGSCPSSSTVCTSLNITLILQGDDTSGDQKDETKCELELGCGLGLGFGIQCVITGITIGISMYTSQSKVSDGKHKPKETDGKHKPKETDGKHKPKETDDKHKPKETDDKHKPKETDGKHKPKETGYKDAYFIGLVHGVGIGVTFQVGWIIIASLICTGTTSCKLELGLGLGLGSGIPWVITIIIAVIFFFSSEDNPSRVEKGKGMLTGSLSTTVIGIIVVYLKYDKLKPEQTGIKPDDNPGTPDDKNTEVCLELTVTISKTTYSGSSAVSREQVQVQMENKGVKDDDEERPPAVHTGTQNKVDPSKQTKDRQQPVPPANTGFEDNPTFRPLPSPPQKGEIKDRNVRGISATIGDTPDLASDTPRPNKLPPILLKQETVQEENVSEEPKKKRKKKKKDQMNVETPEEENGETDMRLN